MRDFQHKHDEKGRRTLRKRYKWSVGVHILDQHAKIVVVEHTAKKIRVLNQEMVQFEAGSVRNGQIEQAESVIQRLKEKFRELELQDAAACLAVPTTNAVMRRSVYPVLKDKELRNRIEVDLLSRDQLPFKEPVFDYVRLGKVQDEVAATSEDRKESKGKRGDEEVLIFATPVDTVERYAHVVEEAGLHARAIELTPLSLHRLLLKTLAANETPADRFLFVHAENEYADISIFENGIPVFMRQQTLTAQQMLDTESDRMGAYGRNLTIEISRILNYYKYSVSKDQEEIEQLYLCTDHDWQAPLTEQIASSFSGHIHTLQLDSAVVNYQALHHAYAVPIGLAMKGA